MRSSFFKSVKPHGFQFQPTLSFSHMLLPHYVSGRTCTLGVQDQTKWLVFRMIHVKDSRSYQWAKFGRLGLPGCTLPKTNSSPLQMDGWNTTFLLGRPIFRGEPLVSGRVCFRLLFRPPFPVKPSTRIISPRRFIRCGIGLEYALALTAAGPGVCRSLRVIFGGPWKSKDH